jgi:hypothetical protein
MYLAGNKVLLLKQRTSFKQTNLNRYKIKSMTSPLHKEGFATVFDFNYNMSGLLACLYSYA